MAYSSIHEATAFEIQMRDICTPPKRAFLIGPLWVAALFVFIDFSPAVSQSCVRAK